MTQQQDLDIDIHLPSNTEQLPGHLLKRLDSQLKKITPVATVALCVTGLNFFQWLGDLIRAYFLSRVFWWALFLVAIAIACTALLPGKYRFVYLAALVLSIGVGIWF